MLQYEYYSIMYTIIIYKYHLNSTKMIQTFRNTTTRIVVKTNLPKVDTHFV